MSNFLSSRCNIPQKKGVPDTMRSTRPVKRRVIALHVTICLQITILSLITATSTKGADLPRIHEGDALVVKVWNHPELSMQVTVDASNAIRLPLSGVVFVGGLDESHAATKISQALQPFVQKPAVSVALIEQETVIFIAGGPSGSVKFQAGETLATAVVDATHLDASSSQSINESGKVLTKVENNDAELRSRIDFKRIGLVRDGASVGEFDLTALQALGQSGPLLHPGDTIVLENKPIQVRVSGDVVRPGMSYLSRDQSLSEAITQAGGLLPTSASNHVILQRADSSQSVALGDPVFNMPAQVGDVLTIPQAPRINVVGTVLSPGIVALRTDSSLLSALYTAGGPTKYANLKSVQIFRGGIYTSYDVTKLTHGDETQNPLLQDGDTVVVPEGHKVDFSGFFGILGGIAAGLANHGL